MNDQAIIIFIKNPALGKVKTRLAKDIGDEKALEIYQLLLKHTRLAVEPLNADKLLYYSEFADHNDNWPNELFTKHVQHNSPDLGDRMYQAFKHAFGNGYQKVLIIGSDCPDISSQVITQAFEELNTTDVVIGPAKDGGYYLLGMNKLQKEYFEGKEWSTSSVREDTIDSVRSLGKTYMLLEELTDVDHAKDLTDIKISLPKL